MYPWLHVNNEWSQLSKIHEKNIKYKKYGKM